MKRNWYAVYTRPEREKKVASILTKRGIKNYIPVNNIIGLNGNNKKPCKTALLGSFVFVYITEYEIAKVKNIYGIVNFFYWMAKPAIIHREEIEAIMQLTSAYHDIKVEKSLVNMQDHMRIIDEPVISFNENSASVMFHTLTIVLPSLGYIMIAEREKAKEKVLEKKLEHADLFSKKWNSLFAN